MAKHRAHALVIGLICFASLLALIADHSRQQVLAAPPRRLVSTNEQTSASSLEPTTSEPELGDYVRNDQEFERLLKRLREEATPASSSQNPGDFVSDEVELDELLRFLDEKEALEELARVTASNSIHTEALTTVALVPGATTTETPLPAIVSDNECEAFIRPRLGEEAQEGATRPADFVANNEVLENLTEDEIVDACNICKEDMEQGKECALKCNHKFHKECIIQWAKTFYDEYRFTCPMCRRTLSKNDIDPILFPGFQPRWAPIE